MLSHLRPAIVMIVLFTLLGGIAYPLAITGIAQLALKGPADGSLIVRDKVVVGSALIGQNFASERYFHGRPSATNKQDPKFPDDSTKTIDAPYNAANSGASNFGSTSQKLLDRVKASVAALGGGTAKPVPADAVTTSASGLDPDISPAFAAMQIEHVANARTLPLDAVQALVRDNTHLPALGIFGEPTVNVLRLNLALDAAGAAPKPAASPSAAR